MISIRQFWSRLPAKKRVIEKKRKHVEHKIECRRRYKINQINKGGRSRADVIKNAYNHIFTQKDRLSKIALQKQLRQKEPPKRGTLQSELLATRKAFSLQTKKQKALKYQHPLRPLVEDIFRERRLSRIGQISDTPKERVTKLLSLKSIGGVFNGAGNSYDSHTLQSYNQGSNNNFQGNSNINTENNNNNKDEDNDILKPLRRAREIIKEQRRRAKEDIPMETKIEFVNGLKHFFPFCQRIHLTYCSSSSSDFLKFCRDGHMLRLIRQNPLVHFSIQPHQGHQGMMRAFYMGGFQRELALTTVGGHGGRGSTKSTTTATTTTSSITSLFKRLLDGSGRRDRKFKAGVISLTPAIRPAWSPFHSAGSANAGNVGNALQIATRNSPLIGAANKK